MKNFVYLVFIFSIIFCCLGQHISNNKEESLENDDSIEMSEQDVEAKKPSKARKGVYSTTKMPFILSSTMSSELLPNSSVTQFNIVTTDVPSMLINISDHITTSKQYSDFGIDTTSPMTVYENNSSILLPQNNTNSSSAVIPTPYQVPSTPGNISTTISTKVNSSDSTQVINGTEPMSIEPTENVSSTTKSSINTTPTTTSPTPPTTKSPTPPTTSPTTQSNDSKSAIHDIRTSPASPTVIISKPSSAFNDAKTGDGSGMGVALALTFACVISVIGLVVFVFYHRLQSYWSRRHYDRMDFLIDGLYETDFNEMESIPRS